MWEVYWIVHLKNDRIVSHNLGPVLARQTAADHMAEESAFRQRAGIRSMRLHSSAKRFFGAAKWTAGLRLNS